MVNVDLERQIDKVLEEAIELALIGDGRVTSRSIAERVFTSEKDLMAALHQDWMVDRLTWMISRKRAKRRFVGQPESQLCLPGFEDLPRSIFLRDGRRQPLDNATGTDIGDHIKMLKARLKPTARIRKLESALELMRPYMEKQFAITWGEVKQKEIARRNREG